MTDQRAVEALLQAYGKAEREFGVATLPGSSVSGPDLYRLSAAVHEARATLLTAYASTATSGESEWTPVHPTLPPIGVPVEVECDDGSVRTVNREYARGGWGWQSWPDGNFWSMAHPNIMKWRRRRTAAKGKKT